MEMHISCRINFYDFMEKKMLKILILLIATFSIHAESFYSICETVESFKEYSKNNEYK